MKNRISFLILMFCITTSVSAQFNFCNPNNPISTNPAAAGFVKAFVGGSVGGGAVDAQGKCDDCYRQFTLPFTFIFAGVRYNQVYINNNGCVSFNQGISTWVGQHFPIVPTVGPLIAIWWGDVDTRNNASIGDGGNVWYRMTADSLIVLWDHVRAYPASDTATCTFRMTIVDNSGPIRQFGIGGGDVEFSYGSRLAWLTGAAGGPPPQAGFDAGDQVHFYDAPGSQTSNMLNLQNQCSLFQSVKNFSSGGSVNSYSSVLVSQGDSVTVTPNFFPATSATVNTGGLCGVTVGTFGTPVNSQPIKIKGQACNIGAHDITIDATASGTNFHHTLRVNVLPPPPVITYPDSLLFFAGQTIASVIPTNTGGTIPANFYGKTSQFTGSGIAGSGNGTSTVASFNTPGHIAIDPFGNLFVRDLGNFKIRKVSPTGTASDFAPDASAFGSIYADADGKVYVPSGDKVYTYTAAGALEFTHSDMDFVPGETLYGYTIDNSGHRTFATGYNNHGINRGTPTGTIVNSFGVQVTSQYVSFTSTVKPAHVATAPDGTMYAIDANGPAIYKILTTGAVSTLINNPAYRFNGLCISATGDVFASSAASGSVYRISQTGAVALVAGGAGLPVDGIGAVAGFKKPVGIVVDFDGTLYVSDSGDHKIRKIATTGYSVTPALPAGLILDASTGNISGTPTGITPRASYTITGYNLNGKSTRVINIEVDSLVISRTCTNGSPASVQVKTSAGISAANYLWYTGSCTGTLIQTSATFSATASTLYAVKPANRPTLNCNTFTVSADPGVVINSTLPASVSTCLYNGTGIGPALTIAATNALNYQWQKDSINIPGATSSTYTLPAHALSDSGLYRVIVTNGCNSVISQATTYKLGNAAIISRISDPQMVCFGTTISMNVVATNATAYQWQKNGGNISGATTAVYTKNSVGTFDTGIYRVVVTGTLGCDAIAYTTIGLTGGIGIGNYTLPLTNSSPVCAGNPVSLSVHINSNPTGPRGKAAVVNGVSSGGANSVSSNNNFTYDFWAFPAKKRKFTLQTTTGSLPIDSQSFVIRPFANTLNNLSGAGVSIGTNGISVFEQGTRPTTYCAALLVYDTILTGWTHIAIVYTNKQPSLYINGVLRKTGLTSVRTTVYAYSGSFGENTTGNFNMYNGAVDNIRVWNGSLTAAEIASVMNVEATESIGTKTTLAHYTFNGNTTNTGGGGDYALPTSFLSIDTPTLMYTWTPLTSLGTPPFADTALTQTTIAPSAGGTYTYVATAQINGCQFLVGQTNVVVTALSNTPVGTSFTTYTTNQPDATTVNYSDASCNPMATVIDPLGGNVLGSTSCTMLKDASVQAFHNQPYLQRHFDILPTNNGAATVELYIPQAEFTAYNTYITTSRPAWPKAPANPTDAAGIANLSVTQYHGLPTGGTTGPGGRYSVANRELIPNSQINTTWNGNYWTMRFPVSGFSGFYISTGSSAPLPIKLESISATNVGDRNRVDWKSASELDNDRYLVQRSGDGVHFTTLTELPATGQSANYTYWDVAPLEGQNYYRLELLAADGTSDFSKVVTAYAHNGDFLVEAYPNPAKDRITVKAFGSAAGNATVAIMDISGRVIYTTSITNGEVSVDLNGLSTGMYLLHYKDEVHSKVIKVSKL